MRRAVNEDDKFLRTVARWHTSRRRRETMYMSAMLLSGVGSLGFLDPVYLALAQDVPLAPLDVLVGVAGLSAVFLGVSIRLVLWAARIVHEILLGRGVREIAPRDEADGQHDRTAPKSSEDGSSIRSLSKSDLRKLSTRNLAPGSRLLVTIPIVVGSLLLALAIGAWQVPRLGNLVFQYGVRLEYLCLGGLVLMMVGAYLMPLGNIIYRRASKRDAMTPR